MLRELDKQHEYPADAHPIITDTDSQIGYYIYNISLSGINLLL
jgi:hypothetical protein